jgi:threonine dehydrogenase-like Zn-dependent dehydrogenase
VAVKTTCGQSAVDLDATRIAADEITIQGSRCGPFTKAIERLRKGLVPVEDYISGVFALDDITAAMEAARRSTKVLIEP